MLTDNLVAYYTFDADNSSDATGNSNTGTDTSITYGSSSGKIGHGASFNGSSSKIALPSNVYGLFSGTSAWSVVIWVNLASLTVNRTLFAANKSASDIYKNTGLFLAWTGSGGDNSGFQAYRGDGSNIDAISEGSTAGKSTGTFYMVTATYDGSRLRLYVNGSQIGTGVASTRAAPTQTVGSLGKFETSSGPSYLNGYLDESAFYSRALSGAEIVELFNSDAGLQYPFGTPVTVTPSAASLSFSAPAPTVIAEQNVTVSVSAATMAVSVGESETSSGPNSPGAATNLQDTPPPFTSPDWSDPENVKTSNDSYAHVTHGGVSNNSSYLYVSDFGFSIPSGAAVTGIKVEVEKHTTLSGGTPGNEQARDFHAQIVKGGVVGSANKSIASVWPTSDAYSTYGGNSDLWDETWTPADINASDFGFAFSSTQGNSSINNSYVDHIRITVYYSTGPTVVTTSTVIVSPSALSIAASAPTPTIQLGTTVSPSPATASFSAPSPSVVLAITPAPATLTFSAPSPTVIAVQNVTVSPGPATAAFSAPTPSVKEGVTVQASAVNAVFSAPAPSVSTTSTVTVTPSALALSFASPAPSVALDFTVTVSAAQAAFSAPEPVIAAAGTVVIRPAPLALDFSAPVPVLSASQVLTVSPLSAAFSTPSPTIIAEQNVTVSATALALSFSAPSPAVGIGYTVRVSPLTIAVSAPAPSFAYSYTVYPSPLSMLFSAPSPIRVGGLWKNEERPSTSWDNETRATTAFTNDSRPTTSLTNEDRAPR